MSGYNRHTQRQYDNQSPDESGNERDEWIAERAEVIADERISDVNKVAEALDDMASVSDHGLHGNTLFSEMVARIVVADIADNESEGAACSSLFLAVREYLMRDAETDAAAEYDAQHLPPNFKGED